MNLKYKIRENKEFKFYSSNGKQHFLTQNLFMGALNITHGIVDKISSFEVNISEILGLRNLSALIGELYVSGFEKSSNGLLLKNPHQDGYPDLLLMDEHGKGLLNKIKKENAMKSKTPFSPFENGGIEVKATCGAVPTPKQCAKKGLEKPGIGDQRVEFIKGYDWKAHHRETNNLIGILWDFIEEKPRIIGDCSIVTGNVLFHSSRYEVSVLFANGLEPVLLAAYR